MYKVMIKTPNQRVVYVFLTDTEAHAFVLGFRSACAMHDRDHWQREITINGKEA